MPTNQTNQVGAIVTPCPVYVGPTGTGKRVADATEGSWEVSSGQDMLIADGGVAFTKGRVTCTMSLKTIIPRAGMVNNLFNLVISQTQVSVRILINGQFQTFRGVISKGSGAWSFADGKCTGDFSFVGANVTTTG